MLAPAEPSSILPRLYPRVRLFPVHLKGCLWPSQTQRFSHCADRGGDIRGGAPLQIPQPRAWPQSKRAELSAFLF